MPAPFGVMTHDPKSPARLESQFAAMMPKLQAAHPELFSASAEPEKVGEGSRAPTDQRWWMGKESALAGPVLLFSFSRTGCVLDFPNFRIA